MKRGARDEARTLTIWSCSRSSSASCRMVPIRSSMPRKRCTPSQAHHCREIPSSAFALASRFVRRFCCLINTILHSLPSLSSNRHRPLTPLLLDAPLGLGVRGPQALRLPVQHVLGINSFVDDGGMMREESGESPMGEGRYGDW